MTLMKLNNWHCKRFCGVKDKKIIRNFCPCKEVIENTVETWDPVKRIQQIVYRGKLIEELSYHFEYDPDTHSITFETRIQKNSTPFLAMLLRKEIEKTFYNLGCWVKEIKEP